MEEGQDVQQAKQPDQRVVGQHLAVAHPQLDDPRGETRADHERRDAAERRGLERAAQGHLHPVELPAGACLRVGGPERQQERVLHDGKQVE